MVRRLNQCSINVVSGCQNRCIACPMSAPKAALDLMTLDDFNAIMRNIDVREITCLRHWAYGEPLLHPQLPEMIEISRKQSFRVVQLEVSTNGQYRRFEMLRDILKTKCVDQFVVSCDGDGTPQEYERLRPPSKWDILIEFLAKTKEYRDKDSPKTTLMTRTVCTDAEGQRRWTAVLAPFGFTPEFRSWIILPSAKANPSGRAPTVRNMVCPLLVFNNLFCDYDGALLPCYLDPRAFVLGDLREQPWSAIWFGGKKLDFMLRLMRERKSMTICGACEEGHEGLSDAARRKMRRHYSWRLAARRAAHAGSWLRSKAALLQ